MSTKVYAVTLGSYSDYHIDILFTTRELADAYVADRRRRTYKRAKAKHDQWWRQFAPDVRVGALPYGYDRDQFPPYETWEPSFMDADSGEVEEFELWDVLPVASPA